MGATGPERGGSPHPETVDVVHIDTDEAILTDIETAVAATEGMSVRTTTDTDTAYEWVRSGEPDCIVAETTVPGLEWIWLGDAVTAPVVLYTGADLTTIDEEVIEAADTLVHKRQTERDHRFLLEKVRAAVTAGSDRSDRGMRESTADLAAAVDKETAVFVVDDEDSIAWASHSFESVFPVDAVGGTVPVDADFRRRLTALLDNDPELARAVLSDAREKRVVGIPVDDPLVYYQFDRHDAGEGVAGERICIFQDVTDVAATYEETDRFQQLVENVREGLYVLNADARLVYCNDAYAEMFGYDREELLGEHTAKWMAPGELQKGQQAVEELLTSDTDSHVVDLEFRRKDGEHITRSVHFTLREGDGYGGLLGVVRRPSEMADAGGAYEQYRPLVEGVDVPIVVLDADCRLRVANEAAASLFETARSDARGRPLQGVLSRVPGGREFATRVESGLDSPSEEHNWETNLGTSLDAYTATVDALSTEDHHAGAVLTLRARDE